MLEEFFGDQEVLVISDSESTSSKAVTEKSRLTIKSTDTKISTSSERSVKNKKKVRLTRNKCIINKEKQKKKVILTENKRTIEEREAIELRTNGIFKNKVNKVTLKQNIANRPKPLILTKNNHSESTKLESIEEESDEDSIKSPTFLKPVFIENYAYIPIEYSEKEAKKLYTLYFKRKVLQLKGKYNPEKYTVTQEDTQKEGYNKYTLYPANRSYIDKVRESIRGYKAFISIAQDELQDSIKQKEIEIKKYRELTIQNLQRSKKIKTLTRDASVSRSDSSITKIKRKKKQDDPYFIPKIKKYEDKISQK